MEPSLGPLIARTRLLRRLERTLSTRRDRSTVDALGHIPMKQLVALAVLISTAALASGCGHDDGLFAEIDDPAAGTYVVPAARDHFRPDTGLRRASDSEQALVQLECSIVGCSCAPRPSGWAIAPGGRHVLGFRGGDLYLGRTRAKLELAARNASDPAWSPDGQKLAFERGTDIWVVGAGGHAKIVIDLIRAMGADTIAGVLDHDPARWGATVLGVPVTGPATLAFGASGGRGRRSGCRR